MTGKSWLDVDSSDKAFGPRTITHEFPLRDDVSHEFIGKLPRTFAIEAILIGDDLNDQVTRFETALDDTSTGRLVHPWYGELDVVVVGEVHTKTSSREGRVARISVTFQLAGGPQSPVTQIDTAATVDRSATAARDAAIRDFSQNFTVDDVQDFVVEHAIRVIKSMTGLTLGTMRGAGLTSDLSQGNLASTATALSTIGPAGLQDTVSLGTQIADLFAFKGVRTKPTLQASNSLISLADPSGLRSLEDPPAGVTPSWKRAAVNQQSLIALAQVTSAIEAARTGSVAGWDSRDQAIAWRDKVAGDLDDAADTAGNAKWDNTWRTATDLRAATVKDVGIRAAPLPKLATYLPPVTLPAPLIAYRIDGDNLTTLFDRQEDLRRRNRVRHPGFVSGGRPLEVLING
jgi:prophage DNA circulation protein